MTTRSQTGAHRLLRSLSCGYLVGRRRSRLAVLLLLCLGTTAFGEEVRLDLQVQPKEDASKVRPTLPRRLLGQPLNILVEDVSEQGDLIGASRLEGRAAANVIASEHARFVGAAIDLGLKTWEVPTIANGLEVSAKILRLWVEEGDRYEATAKLRMVVRDASGNVLHDLVGEGRGSTWGRSRKAANYCEALTDAVLAAVARALSRESETDARSQEPPTGRPHVQTGIQNSPAASTPAEVRAHVLDLKAEGFAEALIVQYVHRTVIAPALTSSDMIEWKRAGISERVIDAALGQGIRGSGISTQSSAGSALTPDVKPPKPATSGASVANSGGAEKPVTATAPPKSPISLECQTADSIRELDVQWGGPRSAVAGAGDLTQHSRDIVEVPVRYRLKVLLGESSTDGVQYFFKDRLYKVSIRLNPRWVDGVARCLKETWRPFKEAPDGSLTWAIVSSQAAGTQARLRLRGDQAGTLELWHQPSVESAAKIGGLP